jgi:hypothetical protein
MDMLLIAFMPLAGIAIMLVTAVMTLPTGTRLAMVSTVRDSQQFRDAA